jgi:hypothetical protein
MNELEPLFDVSASARTRALLRAGRKDTPPDDFSQRLLAGLGVAAVATTVSISAAASASGAAVSSAASSSGGAVSAVLAVSKWVAVGVLGGGIFAAGVDLALAPQPALPVVSNAVPVAKPASVPSKPQPRSGAGVMPETAPQAVPDHQREAVLTSPRPTEPTAAAAVAAGAAGSPGQLGREVASIDRARQALGAGDAAGTLQELDSFEHTQQTGVLEREARVLRIDALLALGQTNSARSLAEQYVQQYPNDAHAARLRALLK